MRTSRLGALVGAVLLVLAVAPAAHGETVRRPVAGVVAAQTFPDVPPTNQFYEEIEYMNGYKVMTGYADGTWRPAAPVTRQAMAAFMYRFAYEPAFTPPTTPTFEDVPATNPFYLQVEWMAAAGISAGYPDDTFRPGAVVSRQAMSAFLFRLIDGGAYTPPAGQRFSDVPRTSTFFAPVSWMAEYGISEGYAGGVFKPGASVSRQAMAAFLYRADEL